MDEIKSKLSGFGAFLSLAGILSSVLYLVGYNLRILMWMNFMGEGVAWLIRIGLIVVGAGMFFLLSSSEDSDGEHGEHGEGSGDDEDEDWDTYRAKIQADPRFAELLAWTQGNYQVTFDAPTDPDTYQIVHWAFTNDTGQQLGPEDPSVLYLSLYLKRGSKPKRLSIGKAFATGEVGVTEMSMMQWGYVVP